MVTNKIKELLIPTIAGLFTYFLVDKCFPEKIKPLNRREDRDVRGGSEILFVETMRKILHNRAIKAAVTVVFITAGLRHYTEELTLMLLSNEFKTACFKDGKLINDPICEMVASDNLNVDVGSLRSLIVNTRLSFDRKADFIAIKLSAIISNKYANKRKLVALLLIGIILSVALSGTAGIAVVLEALRRMVTEERLDEATYRYLRNIAEKAEISLYTYNVDVDSFVES